MTIRAFIISDCIPTPFRLSMVSGNTTTLYITFNRNLDKYDLTSCKLYFTLKQYVTDTDQAAIFQKVSPTNISIVDAVNGLVRIVIEPSDTINLNKWFYEYFADLKLIDPNGIILTTACGTLGIYPSITQVSS